MRLLTFSSALLFTLSAVGATTPAQAQGLEIVGQSGDYQISRVVESKVCFAVLNLQSEKGLDASYATFKTADGDRWQVAGYLADDAITLAEEELWITFDGAMQLRRMISFSKSDFALPITTDEELASFDSYVENAAEMKLKLIKFDDAIAVELDGLRTARTAIDTCLEGIE